MGERSSEMLKISWAKCAWYVAVRGGMYGVGMVDEHDAGRKIESMSVWVGVVRGMWVRLMLYGPGGWGRR